MRTDHIGFNHPLNLQAQVDFRSHRTLGACRPALDFLRLFLVAVTLIAVSCCVTTCFAQEPSTEKSDETQEVSEETKEVPQQESDRVVEEKVLTPEEKKEKADREAARKRGDLTFDDLAFAIEKGEKFEEKKLPKSMYDFHEKKITIRGYILPNSVFQQENIKQFVLVRDNQECCFGPGAAIYDCIIIEVDTLEGAKFTTRPITVKGRFEIDIKSFVYPDGMYFAIYKMVATEVK